MTDYYILITDAGAALEASAHASGSTVELASFGVCDGGVEFTPDPTLTTFANEVYSGPISSLVVSSDDPTVLVAQCVIPATSGGYTIRGIALYAADGTLYATGNYPDQQKPATDSGYSASLEILAQLAVSDTADIALHVTDGSYLTEQEADTLYLRQENNLSDLTDAGKARMALGLGSAATHDESDFLYTSGGQLNGRVNSLADQGFVQNAPWIDVSGNGTNYDNGGFPIWLNGDPNNASYHLRGRVIDQYDWAQWIMNYPGGSQYIEMRSTGELLFNGIPILTGSAAITGIRMANYGSYGSGGIYDSSHKVLTGIYANNGWDNPSTQEARTPQYCINGYWYDVAYV